MTLSRVRTQLVKTLTEVVDSEQLEQQYKEVGACVCDDYKSYSSTLTPGMPVAAMMQFEDCVNCHDLCCNITTIAINNNKIVSEDTVNARLDTEIAFAKKHRQSLQKWCSDEGFKKLTDSENIQRLNDIREEILVVVRNGRAQKIVDKFFGLKSTSSALNAGKNIIKFL